MADMACLPWGRIPGADERTNNQNDVAPARHRNEWMWSRAYALFHCIMTDVPVETQDRDESASPCRIRPIAAGRMEPER